LKDKFLGKFIVLDGPDGCGKIRSAEFLRNGLKILSLWFFGK